MSRKPDANERPDLQPGFYAEYVETDPVSQAIQTPLHPPDVWINRVLNAHRKAR